MQIGMGFGKFLARVLFQELGVSVPSSVFHVLFITRSLHAKKKSGLLLKLLGRYRLCLVSLGANTQDVVVLDPVAAIDDGARPARL